MTLSFLKSRQKIISYKSPQYDGVDLKSGVYGGGIIQAPAYVYVVDVGTVVPRGGAKKGA